MAEPPALAGPAVRWQLGFVALVDGNDVVRVEEFAFAADGLCALFADGCFVGREGLRVVAAAALVGRGTDDGRFGRFCFRGGAGGAVEIGGELGGL